MVLYSSSWFLKLVSFAILRSAKNSGTIGKPGCYAIWISQKFHMIILNSIAMDLIPYTLRTIFDSKGLPAWLSLSSVVLLSLLVFDFLEI